MNKVLMIGLDGATFSLLKPLMEIGVMPFLEQFVADGVHGDLMSTRNPLTPPAWMSMITGRSPHIHGIYDFLRPVALDDGSVFLKVNDSRDIRCETVWSMASRQQKRVTSLNFYGMSPAQPVNGYLASGFVPWKHLRHGMYPESLFEIVKAMPGFDYKTLGMDIGEEKKCVQGLLEGEHEDWIALQDERDTAWVELCCHLMKTDPTDLTAVVLDGPDKVQHLFWRFVDPALMESNPSAWFTHIRGRCLDYYRKLDINIKRLVETAGSHTDVIMTSDHGFGATTEIVYINEWLARRGYLEWANAAEQDDIGKLTANRMKEHLGMVDWKNTIAFCPTPSSNAIYIKKDNGSGHGVKDSEYLEFCLNLKKELLAYRDSNGEAVIVGVDLNKLEGVPFVEPSPDITLRLRDGGFVSILKSSEVVSPRTHVDGTHRPNGIFIGRGPNIRSGQTIAPLSLLDITPLLLYLLGLAVPADLEGRTPEHILRSGLLASRPVAQIGSTLNNQDKSPVSRDEEPSPEEYESLMKQLKILGYMD